MHPFRAMGIVENLLFIQAYVASPPGGMDGLGWLDLLSYIVVLFRFMTD